MVITIKLFKMKREYDTRTQFELDWDKPMIINNMEANMGYYNLIVSIRDVSSWTKGIRPHRNWRLKQVKDYFGLVGSADKILARLRDFRDGNL